ncbi:hypothetical protein [Geoalkalibacter subterraneus]|uniref:Uncharacterized protein n=1 Tax=Geoalkalibacter subterraneus TaxID=483547 RepID=A0A0B5FS59_9BACT|nr:hypothetical protein [Geoalkalibacter subterraneus]AJF07489.1 hypothetical protein GSUB_14315 [Geoalkalibacter subterraneus]
MERGTWTFIIVTLFLGSVTAAAAVPGIMEGFGGIVIAIFLVYCAIIVVAQLFSALFAVQKIIEGYFEKRQVSRRVELR